MSDLERLSVFLDPIIIQSEQPLFILSNLHSCKGTISTADVIIIAWCVAQNEKPFSDNSASEIVLCRPPLGDVFVVIHFAGHGENCHRVLLCCQISSFRLRDTCSIKLLRKEELGWYINDLARVAINIFFVHHVNPNSCIE